MTVMCPPAHPDDRHVSPFSDDSHMSTSYSGGGDDVTCITFQSVDAAFSKARDRLGLPRPKKVDNAEQRAELGAVLLETTRLIAKE